MSKRCDWKDMQGIMCAECNYICPYGVQFKIAVKDLNGSRPKEIVYLLCHRCIKKTISEKLGVVKEAYQEALDARPERVVME